MLHWFESVLGVKINQSKPELVPVREVSNLEELVAVLGCKQSNFPIKYLGHLSGAKFKEKMI